MHSSMKRQHVMLTLRYEHNVVLKNVILIAGVFVVLSEGLGLQLQQPAAAAAVAADTDALAVQPLPTGDPAVAGNRGSSRGMRLLHLLLF